MDNEEILEDSTEPVAIPDDIKNQMMAVLRVFVNIGVIGRSFDNAGVPRKYHAIWMEKYPIYKKRFEEVRNMFVDGLECVAIDRAKEKSDALLMMMLKAHRPEVYGDKSSVSHKFEGGNTIQLVFAEGLLNDEEKKLIEGTTADGQEA